MMAKDKKTLRFWHRVDRMNQDGSAPIHLIYQIQGNRKYYAVPDAKAFPPNWDPKEQKAIYLDKKACKKAFPEFDTNLLLLLTEVDELNEKLDQVRWDVRQVEKRFELDGRAYSTEMVINALKEAKPGTTKKDSPTTSITAFITQFIKDSQATHKAGTLKVYYGLGEHVSAFEKIARKRASFEEIDHPFLRAFHGFLTTVKEKDGAGMNNITAAKQISTLKTILNYARTIYKIKVNQDYRDFKVTRKDSDFEVITLTEDEFLTLFNFDLSENKKLAQVRDVFCFSCATGLRFSDLMQLKREHIRGNAIKMTAAKTGQRLDIPLNPYSAGILDKYKGISAPLPMISNQKTNDYIKELCELAGFDSPIEISRQYGVDKVSTIYKKYELMSIHVGRKTFTTLSLERGMAPQEVMSLTGHSTYKAFKRYVDVTNERKKTVMAKAWGEVKNPLKKAE